MKYLLAIFFSIISVQAVYSAPTEAILIRDRIGPVALSMVRLLAEELKYFDFHQHEEGQATALVIVGHGNCGTATSPPTHIGLTVSEKVQGAGGTKITHRQKQFNPDELAREVKRRLTEQQLDQIQTIYLYSCSTGFWTWTHSKSFASKFLNALLALHPELPNTTLYAPSGDLYATFFPFYHLYPANNDLRLVGLVIKPDTKKDDEDQCKAKMLDANPEKIYYLTDECKKVIKTDRGARWLKAWVENGKVNTTALYVDYPGK